MAVTYPRAGNLGGGGFMLIHLASGKDTAIDYRETAPQGITNKTFLDADGNADPHKSRDTALAIGVPGTVAGLAMAEQKYGSGRFTLAQLVAPAIALARDGFAVTGDLSGLPPSELTRLGRWPSTAKDFSQSRRQATVRLAIVWCRAILAMCFSRSQPAAPAHFMTVLSLKRSLRRFRLPAA